MLNIIAGIVLLFTAVQPLPPSFVNHSKVKGDVEIMTNMVEWSQNIQTQINERVMSNNVSNISYSVSTNVVTNIVTRTYVEDLGISVGLTTNDVKDIVTNNVSSSWVTTTITNDTGDVLYMTNIVYTKIIGEDYSEWLFDVVDETGAVYQNFHFTPPSCYDSNTLHLVSRDIQSLTATRQSVFTGNSLGLAYNSDLLSVASYVAGVVSITNDFLSAHGGTATAPRGTDDGGIPLLDGVSYFLEGGITDPSYHGGSGASITLGGGGGTDKVEDFYAGKGATLTIEGGGSASLGGGEGALLTIGGGGDSENDAGKGGVLLVERGGDSDSLGCGQGARIIIGGHGSGFAFIGTEEVEIQSNGYLTITHTGNNNEDLTDRIKRDSKSGLQIFQGKEIDLSNNEDIKYAISNLVIILGGTIK